MNPNQLWENASDRKPKEPFFKGYKPAWHNKFFKIPEKLGVTVWLPRGNR